MKKSNWIIAIILVLAACFFLWLWYYLKFNFIDNPLDLVLTIVWWVLVAIVCVAISKVEKTRQERIRTTYIGPGVMFNPEAGVVSFGTSGNAVEKLQEVLAGLEYNFDRQDAPEDQNGNSTIAYKYIVRSQKFKKSDDQAAEQEPEWEGEVYNVASKQTQTFANKQELVALIA